MDKRYTFVTLLSTHSYLPGVQILYRSLRKYGRTRYPLLCLCSRGIADEDMATLEAEGIECRRLQESALSVVGGNANNKDTRWEYTFDKLLIWGLTEYDKIVFLDSDMMILNPIDDLFDRPAYSAVVDESFMQKEHYSLNSGLMVIEPDLAFKQKLLDAIRVVSDMKRDTKNGLGDQDVIQHCLPHWGDQQELHLPLGYNVFFYKAAEYAKLGYSSSTTDENKQVRVIHFIFAMKPWLNTFRQTFKLILIALYDRDWCGLKHLLLANYLMRTKVSVRV